MLSTEPPETSEKPLPPVFPEVETLISQDTAGDHPSGRKFSSQVRPNWLWSCCQKVGAWLQDSEFS